MHDNVRGALKGRRRRSIEAANTMNLAERGVFFFLMMWELAMGEDYWGAARGFMGISPLHPRQ